MSTQDEICMQAIYLMAGAETARHEPVDPIIHSEGHLGQAQLMCDFAQQMADFLNFPRVAIADFPGVFHYEVTEDMGGWLMRNQNASKNEFRVELDRVYLEFLTQGIPK